MVLFLRVALTNSLTSGMIGKRRTKKTFDPRFAMRLATYRFTPEIRATTIISVETERTIPNNIRNDRSLCARSVSRATKMGSRKLIRVFMKSRRSIYTPKTPKKIHGQTIRSKEQARDRILHGLSHSQETVYSWGLRLNGLAVNTEIKR